MDDQNQTAANFTVRHSNAGGKVILLPSGSVTFEHCDRLWTAFEAACENHVPDIVLDCRSVGMLDSAALELLMKWHEKLHMHGKELVLTHLNDVCSDILTATRLSHVLTVCSDSRGAVKTNGIQ